MRSPLLSVAALLLAGLLQAATAQVVTTDPVFPSADHPVTIYFHAREGNSGLAGHTGDVYAHTGVITDRSTSPSDWRYVVAGWRETDSPAKMTRVATDLYSLHIDDIRSFYEVEEGETIRQLAFVFWGVDGGEGRDVDNKDIFVKLYEPGLNTLLLAPSLPTLGPVVAGVGGVEVVALKAIVGTTDEGELRLVVNGETVASTTDDTLRYRLMPQVPGIHTVAVVGELADATGDSVGFSLWYAEPVADVPMPAGLEPGITYEGATTASFVLYAPYKEYAYLLGDFNNWSIDPDYRMRRAQVTADSAYFWLTLDRLEPGREYAFQYLVDGALRVADPYAEKVLWPEDTGIPASVYPGLKPYPQGKAIGAVSVLQTAQAGYQWQVDDFERPAPEELVIYELLVRDFVARHDYATLVDTLDYLARLGVNAVELMPVMEFEGNESWGYNTAGFYFAPDKYYGPADELKRFVDEAHRRGMAVVLDLVLNHSYGGPMVDLYRDASGRPSVDNPWFNTEHNFANTAAHWGYDFDHESPATQAFVDRVTRYWLEAYRVDGFRFDFTKGFSNNFKPLSDDWGSRYDADRVRLLKRMVDAMWAAAPGSYAIMEHLAEDREDRELAAYGMLLWGNTNHAYNEATMGYADADSDFSSGFYRSRGFTEPRLVTYMESHDEERLMFRNLRFGNSAGGYDVKKLPVALDRMKLAGAFFFTLPGPKMIWQFGELGYDVSIDQGGRLSNKPIRWDYARDPLRQKLYRAWAALLKLRREHEVFTSPETQVTFDTRAAVKRIRLAHPSMNVVVVGNFSVIAVRDVQPGFGHTGWWYDFFEGDSLSVDRLDYAMALEPGEFHVYTDRPVDFPEPDLVTVGVEDGAGELPAEVTLAQNYPNPFNPATTIGFALPEAGPVRLDVFDLLGRRVAVLVDDVRPAGAHTLAFDAGTLPSGTYLYRLQAAGRTAVRRMTLFK